jgi:hypothetical protein
MPLTCPSCKPIITCDCTVNSNLLKLARQFLARWMRPSKAPDIPRHAMNRAAFEMKRRMVRQIAGRLGDPRQRSFSGSA